LQRKVSGTGAVTITSTTENEFYNFSFPSTSAYDDDEDEEDEDVVEDFGIVTDEETDAELEQHVNNEEHHDVIHPDMVKIVLQNVLTTL
jgi:serine/threonine-protein phosphatase 2A regulatory subunit B'